jgi:NADH-quinone oxidoreductase subunit I
MSQQTPIPQPARRPFLADVVGTTVSILKGLSVTFRALLAPKVTVNYPDPKDQDRDYWPRPGYRGDFALITDKERKRLRCTACMSCVRACPDKCIHIVGEGKGKDGKPTEFYIDLGLCMFCHLCVEACPFDALTMTPHFEQSVDDPRKLIRNLEELTYRGLEYDDVLRTQTAKAETTDAPAAPES